MAKGTSTLRRVLKIFGISAASAIVLLAVASALILTPPVQRYLKTIAETEISKQLTGTVTIGRIRSNVISRIDLYDVVMKGPGSGGDSLSFKQVHCRYLLPRLLDKKVDIRYIRLEKAFFSGVRDSRGKVRLPFLPRPQKINKQKSAWSIELHSIRLRKISACWIDSSLAISAALKEMNCDFKFHTLDSFDFSLSTGSGWARTPWWDGSIAAIKSGGTLTPHSLLLAKTAIDGESTSIKGQGLIPFSLDLSWNLAAEVETDMRRIKVLRSVKAIGNDGHVKARAQWTGPLVRPRLTLDAQGRGLAVHGIKLDDINLSGSYNDKGTMAGTLKVTTAIGHAKIAADIDLPHLMTGAKVTGYHGKFAIDGIKVKACARKVGLHQPLPPSTADVHGEIWGKTFTSLPDMLQADLSLRDSTSPDTGAFINARVSMRNRGWDLQTTCGAANNISGSGKFKPAGGLEGRFSFSIKQPFAITRFFLPDRVTGSLQGDGTMQGTFKKPRMDASVSGAALSWKSITADTIAANVSYVNKQFAFAGAMARAHGSLDAVLPVFHLPAIRGNVILSAQGSGPVDDPVLTVHAEIMGPGYKTYAAGKISCDALYSRDTVTVQKLVIDNDSARLKAEGSFSIKKPCFSGKLDLFAERNGFAPAGFSASGSLSKDTITAQLATGRCSMDLLTPWLGKPLPVKGVFSLDSRLSGTLKNPEASLRFSFDQLLKNKPLASYKGTISLKDSVISTSLQALADGSTKPVSLKAKVPFSFKKPFSIKNSIHDGASASLQAENVDISPFFRIADSQLAGKGALNASIDLQKSASGWGIQGKSDLWILQCSDTAARLRLDTLSLHALASGTLDNPEVKAEFKNAAASWKSLAVRSSAGHLELRHDTLIIDTLMGFIQKGHIAISGTVPIHAAMDSLLIKKGLLLRYVLDEVPIAPFSRFVHGPPVKSGTLSGTGSIEASQSRPYFNGALSLKNVSVRVMDCDEPFGPVNAELLLRGDSLIIKSLSGKSETTGRLRGSGFLCFGKNGHANLHISTSDLRLQCVDLDAGIEKAGISLVDSAGSLVINADVRLGESRYTSYLSVANIMAMMGRPRVAAKTSNAFLDKIKLRTTVHLLQNLSIETNMGQFKLDGTVSVVGTPAQPGIIGSVSIEEGFVYYLDRKFTIDNTLQSNTVRFQSPYQINPLVNITATSEVSSYNAQFGTATTYTITLRIQGEMQKPEIVLTGKDDRGDVLRPEQIISLLTLGTIQGNFGSDVTGRVQSLALQQAAGFGSRKLEKLLKIESINIEPVTRADSANAQSSKDNGVLSAVQNQDAVVTAVKRITPRLTLLYQTDLKDLSKPNAMVSYRLLPFLYLDGTGDYVGNIGLDLRVRFTR